MAAFDYTQTSISAASGVSYEVYGIDIADIISFPTLPTTGTYQEKNTYVGNFQLKSGASWSKIQCIPDTGKLVSKKIGGKNSNTWENVVSASLLGSDENPKGFLSEISGKNMIFIAPDKCGGRNHVIGSHCSPAMLTEAEVSTGDGKSGERKSDFTIESTGAIAPIYEGDIPLVPVP